VDWTDFEPAESDRSTADLNPTKAKKANNYNHALSNQWAYCYGRVTQEICGTSKEVP
jgi:hypothetical protein